MIVPPRAYIFRAGDDIATARLPSRLVPYVIDVAANLRAARTFGVGFGIDGARFVPGRATPAARRGHFDTRDTKITKGAKKSHGAFAAETAGTSFAAT